MVSADPIQATFFRVCPLGLSSLDNIVVSCRLVWNPLLWLFCSPVRILVTSFSPVLVLLASSSHILVVTILINLVGCFRRQAARPGRVRAPSWSPSDADTRPRASAANRTLLSLAPGSTRLGLVRSPSQACALALEVPRRRPLRLLRDPAPWASGWWRCCRRLASGCVCSTGLCAPARASESPPDGVPVSYLLSQRFRVARVAWLVEASRALVFAPTCAVYSGLVRGL